MQPAAWCSADAYARRWPSPGLGPRGSIILTNNKAFSEWGAVFADDVLATAILDRLLHHCDVLSITGPSWRLKDRFLTPPAAGTPRPPLPQHPPEPAVTTDYPGQVAPSRDNETTTPHRATHCPTCQQPFTATGRQAYFTNACRQIAYRRRHRKDRPDQPAAPAGRSLREHTIYLCQQCDTRYLATQWCPDCNRPCHRLGPGGECGSCGELLTVDELLAGNLMP